MCEQPTCTCVPGQGSGTAYEPVNGQADTSEHVHVYLQLCVCQCARGCVIENVGECIRIRVPRQRM